jgi:DNA-binding NtrC family response regulator
MIAKKQSHSPPVIGVAKASQEVAQLIQRAGTCDVPVLILGETGVGKEIAARSIYSVRSQGEFVPIDCSALPMALMESELFGWERGAFTNAVGPRTGLLRMADKGTAFFDEVGELSMEAQVKLLRVLDQQEIRPLGSDRTVPCSFRIVAATNRDLKDEVKKNRFRMDLYYRINAVTLVLPSLRERKEDIPLLFSHFLALHGPSKVPGPGLLEALAQYHWPGNIRQLQNCVMTMIGMSSDSVLQLNDFAAAMKHHDALPTKTYTLEPEETLLAHGDGAERHNVGIAQVPASMADAEKQAIVHALDTAKGSRKGASIALGIGRTTLYRKMKQYGLLA